MSRARHLAEAAAELLPHLAGALSRALARGEDAGHLVRALALCGRYLQEAEGEQ